METFDWTLAISRNRDELLRIVAVMFALAGIGEGRSVATLPRHLRSRLLLILRPAESAVRRLIIIAARGLVVKVRPARSVILGLDPRQAQRRRCERTHSGGSATSTIGEKTALSSKSGTTLRVHGVGPRATTALRLSRVKPGDDGLGKTARPNAAIKPGAFPLLDPRKRFDFDRPRYATTVPRIAALCRDWSVPVYMRQPEPPAKPEPSLDDPVDAAQLCRRLHRLRNALDDLDGQARRLARFRARSKLAGPVPGRCTEPMRPGWPPGHRKRHIHDIDEVLRECHSLAVYARSLPDPNTRAVPPP